jgi:hypothetical protein
MYILYNHYGINEDSEMLWLIFTNETRAKAGNFCQTCFMRSPFKYHRSKFIVRGT